MQVGELYITLEGKVVCDELKLNKSVYFAHIDKNSNILLIKRVDEVVVDCDGDVILVSKD